VLLRGTLYRDMWSCYAPGWNDPDGFSASRLCALPGYNCAATSLGACFAKEEKPARCATDDGSVVHGDGDFESCLDDNGHSWRWPITTFVSGIPGRDGK
jgi:hypothetical protein